MKIDCPSCGRKTAQGSFCERCGAELACVPKSVVPEERNGSRPKAAVSFDDLQKTASAAFSVSRPDSPLRRPVAPPRPLIHPGLAPFSSSRPGAQPSLKIDNLCVQFENTPGIVRFLLDPGGAADCLHDVRLLFEHQLTGERIPVRPIRFLDRVREIPVSFPAQSAGAAAWSVAVEYECGGLRHVLDGDIQMVVVHPREAQKVAEHLAINITNTINNGNASDVHVNQRAADELAKLSVSENPFDELRRVILGPTRAWDVVELYSAHETESLPPMPAGARTERLTLDLGVRRITFFAGRTVTFGRKKESNDISLRPSPDASEAETAPYMRVSRAHCHFEHQGEKIVVCDGQRDAFRVLQPSACGTYWNDVRIDGTLHLSSGESGVLSFGDAASAGGVALDAKVATCLSAAECGRCPYSDKHWCGAGSRPSLMLTRRDGVPERFVAVWSCFRLSEADPSFEGVVVFRKEGAFAWRKGHRCGWIVPGTKQQTDFGTVTVS